MNRKFQSSSGIRLIGSIAVALCGVIGAAKGQSFTVGTPIPLSAEENLLVAGGGDVSVTIQFVGASAADMDILSLYAVSPNSGIISLVSPLTTPLVNNQTTPVGAQIDLGSFAAGSELIFQVYNANTKTTFYSGSDSYMDPDGVVHFDVQGSSGGSTTVGVEDLAAFQGSDFDYNDVVYTFSGVSAQIPGSSVPEASMTLPMFGIGLGLLGMFARRIKK